MGRWAATFVTGLLLAAVLGAQQRQNTGSADAGDLEVFQVRPNFYVIGGAGANISVQTGQDGVVVVDAGTAAKADLVVAAIKRLSPQPIRYVIDTSADPDHVGGNERIAKAGRTLFNTNNPFSESMTNNGAAAILSAEKVLTRMSPTTGQKHASPTASWPTETFRR